MKLRQDVWTNEHDNLLQESVLKHIKEGSTQTAAYEEVGEQLDRTAAACAFRFNSVIRAHIQKEINEAKRERLTLKKRKSANGEAKKTFTEVKTSDEQVTLMLPEIKTTEDKKEVSLESIMQDIQTLLENKKDLEAEGEREELLRENMMLRTENAELKDKINEVNKMFEMLKSLNLQ